MDHRELEQHALFGLELLPRTKCTLVHRRQVVPRFEIGEVLNESTERFFVARQEVQDLAVGVGRTFRVFE